MIKDPDAPAPIPKFRTARANLEHVVYDSKGFGGRGGLANPIGGYSDAVTLAQVLLTYDRYWPAVQDYEDPLTPALETEFGRIENPRAGLQQHQYGPRWSERVKALGVGDRCQSGGRDPAHGWGHLDVLCGTYAKKQVYAPTLAWLRQHAADGGTWPGGRLFGGAISTSAAANAHTPKHRPITAHTVPERPRRLATIAVSGASVRLTMAEVTIRSSGLSL